MNVYLGGLYKEVEYIETSGTQYIETPFITQDGYLYKTKVRYLSFNTNWCNFGGGYSNSPYARFFFGARGDRNQWTWGLGSNFGDLGSVSTGVDYELEVKLYNGSQSFIVNGSTLKTDTFSFSTSERYNVCLIGSSYYDVTLAWSSTRVYYYKLYDSSNNLVLDMIPCYRLSDNEIGMFDKVNNQFYTNSGTGTFTKGSDIKTFQAELKNAYIGEYKGWKPGSNTIAYYPLTANANDYSGNGYNATNYEGVFSEQNGCYFGTILSRLELPSMTIGQTFTINAWIKLPNGQPTGDKEIEIYYDWSSSHRNLLYSCVAGGINCYTGNNYTSQNNKITSATFGTGWNNIILSKTGTSYSIYQNGIQLETFSSTYNVSIPGGSNTINIGHVSYSTSEYSAFGYIKDYIIENKARTAQEVLDYYNQTKSNY